MAVTPLVDMWSGLDHKAGMDIEGAAALGTPEYLPPHDRRRIAAFYLLAAFMESKARVYLNPNADDPDKELNRRELGDAGVIISRIAAAMLGEDPEIAIWGAESPIPDRADVPDAPLEPSGDLSEAEGRIAQLIFDTASAEWERRAEAIVEEWRKLIEERPALEERHRWLQNWARESQFINLANEMERESLCVFGSGIWTLGWDAQHKRVGVDTIDALEYFPVLVEDAAFPDRLHLVWEFPEEDSSGEEVQMVRRVPYELVPTDPAHPDYEQLDFGAPLKYLTEGQTQTQACLYSNAVFKLDDFESTSGMEGLERWEQVDFAGTGTLVDADRVPLSLDFIPVVHIPHTPSSKSHFGRPPLVRLAQLLDELSASDTDEALAAQWAAQPPVGVSGTHPGDKVDLTPGKAVPLGDGELSIFDMARNLEKVGARIKDLLRRLSVNSEVPEGLIGRVDASDVPSGVAFTLSFTAFQQMVLSARSARAPKYELLVKMVQRIAIQAGDETLNGSTDVYPGGMEFGSFMPQDLLGVAQVIQILRNAKAISQETALSMLSQIGVPSEDLAAELASIRSEMGDEALAIADATGSARHAIDFLGVDDFGADEEVDPDGDPGTIPGDGQDPTQDDN